MVGPLMATLTPDLSELGWVIEIKFGPTNHLICVVVRGWAFAPSLAVRFRFTPYCFKLTRSQCVAFGSLIGRCFYVRLFLRFLSLYLGAPIAGVLLTSNYIWWIPALFAGVSWPWLSVSPCTSTLINLGHRSLHWSVPWCILSCGSYLSEVRCKERNWIVSQVPRPVCWPTPR